MRIARVFPAKTNMTPIDKDAYYSYPDLFTPKYDEVHISTVFTWDKERAERLAVAWEHYGRVKIGGCAYDDRGGEFKPGIYVRNGITITSRGCPFNCKFCFVPKREGRIRELDIKEGSTIQDNNFLACSKQHRSKVYDMLRTQRAIEFKGGIDARLLTDWDIDQMRGLRIKSLWFACDQKESIKPLRRIVDKLKVFPSYKKRCYVLIGFNKQEEEERLKTVYGLGFYPFAQLYKNGSNKKYSKDWRNFQRTWARPAAYKSYMSGRCVG